MLCVSVRASLRSSGVLVYCRQHAALRNFIRYENVLKNCGTNLPKMPIERNKKTRVINDEREPFLEGSHVIFLAGLLEKRQ
jgi:hypothetical protein